MAVLPFAVLYTQTTSNQQVGVTGLTPTVNVYRITLADNTVLQVVTNGSAFEIGNGLYGYGYSATLDFTLYWYVARFTTTNTAVQAKDIAAAWFDYPSSLAKDSSGRVTVITYTGNTVQTGDAFARLGAPIGASISADIVAVQADTDNIQTRLPAALVGGRMDASVGAMATGVIVAASFTAGAIDAAALAADAGNEIADAMFARTLGTEAYAADGAVPTFGQMQFMIWGALAEFAISGTTITVKKLDGSATAMTFTLDSASAPTSRTRAT